MSTTPTWLGISNRERLIKSDTPHVVAGMCAGVHRIDGIDLLHSGGMKDAVRRRVCTLHGPLWATPR